MLHYINHFISVNSQTFYLSAMLCLWFCLWRYWYEAVVTEQMHMWMYIHFCSADSTVYSSAITSRHLPWITACRRFFFFSHISWLQVCSRQGLLFIVHPHLVEFLYEAVTCTFCIWLALHGSGLLG